MTTEHPIIARAWEPLKPGDNIALVFPSHRPGYWGGSPAAEVAHHRQWIAALSLTLNNDDSLDSLLSQDEWGKKDGAAQRRADYIIAALSDPAVKAIYVSGGDGADEVICKIEKHFKEHGLPTRDDAIPLIGFSDATQLQLYLGELGLVSPIQSALDGGSAVSDLLFKQESQEKIPLIPLNAAAIVEPKIEGKSIGGNDKAIYWAHRSNYRLQTAEDRNNILLLEGTTTSDFCRALDKLAKQGQLDKTKVKAIILGQCYNEAHASPLLELTEKIKDFGIPVFAGAPFGHTNNRAITARFLPIPLNTETTIETIDGSSTVSFSPFRTKEDIEAAKRSYASRIPWMAEPRDTSGLASANPVFQHIELHQVHGSEPGLVAPTTFVGCSSPPLAIPAIEGVNLRGQDLLINIYIPGVTDIAEIGGFWSFAQKATMPIMELIKMGQENVRSITFSAQIPFPAEITDYLKAFTHDHLPGKPIFTALIPDSEMVAELYQFSAPDPATPIRAQPLSVTLNTHFKSRDLNTFTYTRKFAGSGASGTIAPVCAGDFATGIRRSTRGLDGFTP